ncbi:MAG: hypothetical protein Tsb0020_21580 [Haliangiales bacterium]
MLSVHCVVADPEGVWESEVMSVAAEESQRASCQMVVQSIDFYRRFSGDGGATLIAREGERVVGFSLLALAPHVNKLWRPYIAELGVDIRTCGVAVQSIVRVGHRGRGIGGALARARLEHAERCGVQHLFSTVHPSNAPSLRLLSRCGFQELERKVVYEERVPRVLLYRAAQPAGRLARLRAHGAWVPSGARGGRVTGTAG